jgi:hypothetical protein
MFINIKDIINNKMIALNTNHIVFASQKDNDKNICVISTEKGQIITNLDGYNKILSLAFLDSNI